MKIILKALLYTVGALSATTLLAGFCQMIVMISVENPILAYTIFGVALFVGTFISMYFLVRDIK